MEVAVWPHNNFQRFIRRIEVRVGVGISTHRTPLMMADPVLLPCPASLGLLIAGIELEAIENRVHEFSQLWLLRPCQGDEELDPVQWTQLAKFIPTP
ncbi:hypothetical protein [Pseudacidovorax intermedius]|uniref:Uncharacterized protein n=1 Tax=Pseudacidovorax intermedius TaxID=433924 RepID=A0A147H072_9BURK|nr:hypothetical protein [Pseudacidovorax intermedius]KTT23226.1 hypothetical protein NS331_08390 [Pseudacidovorax intermedius]